jgi:DNA-binding transcriptional ArsR family regulator
MKRKPSSEKDLVKLFGSVSRARILCFLYAFPGQSFYQREIMFETGLALRAVQRELANLAVLEIVKTQRTHNRVYYELNHASAFFRPLGEILGSATQK